MYWYYVYIGTWYKFWIYILSVDIITCNLKQSQHIASLCVCVCVCIMVCVWVCVWACVLVVCVGVCARVRACVRVRGLKDSPTPLFKPQMLHNAWVSYYSSSFYNAAAVANMRLSRNKLCAVTATYRTVTC